MNEESVFGWAKNEFLILHELVLKTKNIDFQLLVNFVVPVLMILSDITKFGAKNL